MAISKARKEELVAQYSELIEQSNAIFLAEYQGLNVKMLEGLRNNVREAEGTFHVTKNTLLRHALNEAGIYYPDDLLLGQTGAGFALNEAPTLAKALVEFAKEEESLLLKGALMGDEFLTVEQVEALAKLPSLDQLRSQILGLVNAPARNIASVVATGVRQVVNVLDAYAKKDEEAAAAA